MDPLEGKNLVARWGFEAHDRRNGEFLLRDDGVLLRRFGGASEDGSNITWSYEPWVRVDWWMGDRTITAAEQMLRAMGYELGPSSPVPMDEDESEPFDPDPPGPDPLGGANIVAHWRFVVEMPNGPVGGEVLVRDDGVLLRRYGGDVIDGKGHWWSFQPWAEVDWWGGHTTVADARYSLRSMGYELHPPSTVPINEKTGPYQPDPPNYLL